MIGIVIEELKLAAKERRILLTTETVKLRKTLCEYLSMRSH